MTPGVHKLFFIIIFFSFQTYAETINTKFAKIKLLDKTTNKVSEKIFNVNTSENWESLNIKIYACHTTSPEEIPEDYVLIEIKDNLDLSNKFIYQGWMISSSPDVTPLEHPIYDLWLADCIIDKAS